MRRSVCLVLLLSAAPIAQAATQTHRCTQSSITVNESERFVSITMERRRNLTQPSVGALVVYGSWQWFLPHGIHRVEFPAFVSRQTIRIPIDDAVYTGTQTTTIRCGAIKNDLPAPYESEVALTVLDDEAPPRLIAPALFEVTETDELQLIEIPVSVDTRFGRGGYVSVQADPFSPNVSVDPRVLFDPDETTDAIRVRIPGNTIAEEDQDVILTLAGDVPTTQIVLRILDDDRPTFDLFFDQRAYDFDETTPSFVTLMRGRDFSAAFDVSILISGRSAQPILVSFAAGETSKTVELPLNDELHTGDRDVTLTLLVSGAVLDTATARIRDDDPVPVLSIRNGSIDEGIDGQRRLMGFKLTLTNPLGVPLRIRFATTPGTADETDYHLFDDSFTFPAGATQAEMSVAIFGDDLLEPDETFTFSIVEVDGPATIGIRQATGTIRNDDEAEPPSVYRFEGLKTEWSESEKWLTATVVRTHRLERASSVTASLTAQSSGRWYSPIVIDFVPGETRKEIRFFIDDHFYTLHTDVHLRLQSPVRVTDLRTVTIAEDEPVPVISIEDLEVTEGATAKQAAFRVTVEPPTDLFFEVEFDVPLGFDDFSISSPVLTIPAFGSASLPVTILGDFVPESTESFEVAIHGISLSHIIRGKIRATGTIYDDDVAGARLTFASEQITRGATTTVTLHLDAPAPAADVIRLSSARPGDLGMPETVAIAAGATSVTFDVTGLRAGVDGLRVDLPSWLGSARLQASLLVYAVSLPVLPDVVRVPIGETVQVTLSFAPPADHDARATLTSFDGRMAEVDEWVTVAPGGTGTFSVYGGRVGSTTIEIRLPAELGRTVVHLPVEVY